MQSFGQALTISEQQISMFETSGKNAVELLNLAGSALVSQWQTAPHCGNKQRCRDSMMQRIAMDSNCSIHFKYQENL